MYAFTGNILIEDEFLRDGLQNEARLFSIEEKTAFVRDLEEAGVKRIQLGSFVHPKWVPQMANTDELFAALTPKTGVTYTALVMNGTGLDRALAVRVKHLSISISASETHSKKNTNRSVAEAKAAIKPVIEKALGEGIAVRAGIQSALGCGFEGYVDPDHVSAIARFFSDMGIQEINIADTAGLANPRQVFALCSRLREEVAADVALSLHLHDTRGLGLANLMAGLEAGVTTFDAAPWWSWRLPFRAGGHGQCCNGRCGLCLF